MSLHTRPSLRINCATVIMLAVALTAMNAVPAADEPLSPQALLDRETFWDNRDWDWYRANIPFFECPDADIQTTYYYRWELLTKHLTYGSPNSGYSFTEFIDRPFWSGAYGAISCPAGHQLYEARWLRDPRYARDYARYWFRTPGAEPRRYSTWLADSVWAVHRVHPDEAFVTNLLPDLVANYEAWEERHFVPDVGLFWQTGHDDGMEYNINSRQTADIVRGAPAYRPTLNAYLWADARAIAQVARLAGRPDLARRFEQKAEVLKARMLALLWDEKRRFFFPVSRNDEERDGHQVRALTKTYETGRFAGDPHGRELIGYVPWQFHMIDPGQGYEAAWAKLTDPDGFYAPFGPTTVERNDPLFVLQKSCCWWSGQSWPYATTQTLKALANLLQRDEDRLDLPVSRAEFLTLLRIYARSHRKDGRPYLAEALHPDTGSFEGHDNYNHSEHYFHSGYCDLVITGLVGLTPRDDDAIEVNPLAPPDWDYFAVDRVPYRGHELAIAWDRTGQRYRLGAGLHVLVDGKSVATSPSLKRLVIDHAAPRPAAEPLTGEPPVVPVNFAVNNDGDYYPRLRASHTGAQSSPSSLIDGNYWYHRDPPNRWTAAGSPHDTDELVLDLGVPRRAHTAKLYFLDDGTDILPPREFTLQTWRDNAWQPLGDQDRSPAQPAGRRANVVRFPEQEVVRLRLVLVHAADGRAGLTELELWGDARLPVEPANPPAGNLAFRHPARKDGFPRASASHTSRYDKVEMVHDGRVVFSPTPHNRWTSYESQTPTDWLAIDFGADQEVGRVDLYIYDDGGGVQAPKSYVVEAWTGSEWRPVTNAQATPKSPTGGVVNIVRFDPVTTSRIRVVFTHDGPARSGLTEIEVWEEHVVPGLDQPAAEVEAKPQPAVAD